MLERYSLHTVDKKHRKVNAANTLKENAKIAFALDKMVFIMIILINN